MGRSLSCDLSLFTRPLNPKTETSHLFKTESVGPALAVTQNQTQTNHSVQPPIKQMALTLKTDRMACVKPKRFSRSKAGSMACPSLDSSIEHIPCLQPLALITSLGIPSKQRSASLVSSISQAQSACSRFPSSLSQALCVLMAACLTVLVTLPECFQGPVPLIL